MTDPTGLVAYFATTPVQVRTYRGSGAHGDVHDTAVTVLCQVTHGARLVRNAAGEEVVSSTRLMCALVDADAFAPGSKVAMDGRDAGVIALERHTSPGLGLPDHAIAVLS